MKKSIKPIIKTLIKSGATKEDIKYALGLSKEKRTAVFVKTSAEDDYIEDFEIFYN